MSHFVVTVLVARESFDQQLPLRDQADDLIAPLLAPYNENIEVEEYQQECYCKGSKARQEASAQANEIHDIDALRQSYWEKPEEERPDWDEHIAAFVKLEKDFLDAHPLKDKADLTCEDCKGTGLRMTQYNPKSKWDWYQVGGGWSGALAEKDYEPEKDPANIEICRICDGAGLRTPPPFSMTKDGITEVQASSELIKCNGCDGEGKAVKWPTQWANFAGDVAPVSTLPDDYAPYAVVTPDGYWHEKGEMGWFGMSRNEMSENEWKDVCRKLFAEYFSAVAVVVDCHI